MTNRRRLIDWTGERCVPWGNEVQGTYEHLHRYVFAAQFSAGRRVLDLACGEGYGAAILAGRAQHVIGIELDAQTVAHSRASYELPNLEFVRGSMLELDAYQDGEFGLVTCFEAIEHIAEHEALVAAVARVLAPDGIFVVSTPDRDAYNARIPEPNPFHVRELDRSEFLALLTPHFRQVSLWGQTGVGGSRLALLDAADGATAHEHLVREHDGTWAEAREPVPTFFVAVATRERSVPAATRSYLLDPTLRALREREERVSVRDAVSRELSAQLDRLRRERYAGEPTLRARLSRAIRRS